ncbi:MAG TPA: SDR family NAD(P)-dependent oxidoreductase, partial [Acidimicrobiales bacterium]|nr:SDR family NAD(P)-dependent oxidoreductase [Acidimicrobiales bacterium]
MSEATGERPGPTAASARPSPAEPPPPHALLEGKVVVVTAAAGTGIGFATARRCIEEGATVVISDAHERRLAEAASALADLAGSPPLAVPCDVTDEAQVQ